MVEEVLDALSDGICLSDARGNILYANPAVWQLLEAPDLQARSKTLCQLLCGRLAVDGASECASTCELLKPGSSAASVTFRGSHGPKEVVTWKNFQVSRASVWKSLRVRCLKAPESAAGGGGRLTIIEDSSAEVEIEKQKEDWRHMIAHDLRAPLTSIHATIRYFQETARAVLPDGGAKLADAAERACRKMLELITLYLDVARLDAGVAELKSAPVRLSDAARGEISALSAAAREKKQEIELSVPEGIVVSADPHMLSRVLQNVLDNAVKFTPMGGSIRLSARVDGAQAELSIKDTGVGLAPDELPLLFDRYHQARARRAGRIQGTGLGLTFCREALKLMGGSIAVLSRLDEGTEFLIRLPLAARAQASGAPEAE
ncbi:MAG: ATP-binding protein [Elusimicrobiota bacterium]